MKSFRNKAKALRWLTGRTAGPVSVIIGNSRYTYHGGIFSNAAWLLAHPVTLQQPIIVELSAEPTKRGCQNCQRWPCGVETMTEQEGGF